jgi:hypothetical protein
LIAAAAITSTNSPTAETTDFVGNYFWPRMMMGSKIALTKAAATCSLLDIALMIGSPNDDVECL